MSRPPSRKAPGVYTLETGQELTVYGVRALETAGTGGSARLVAYRRLAPS
jgi:hypothetical protein